MDALLAPVYESFLAVRKPCLKCGGFVVGPMGIMTTEDLFEFACEAGIRDKEFPYRFTFSPMLPGVVYESHVEDGVGGFRYMGLIDEIEINHDGHVYRFPKMKPGEGHHGEEKYDERMPTFVRFKVLEPVEKVMGVKQLYPGDVGLSSGVLRRFMIRSIRKTSVREAFERLLGSA